MSVYYLYKLHRDSCPLLPANHTCEEMMRKYIRNEKVVDTRREAERMGTKTFCVLISHNPEFYRLSHRKISRKTYGDPALCIAFTTRKVL